MSKWSRNKNPNLGRLIADQIYFLRVTQTKFAELTGVDRTLLSKILRGYRYPSKETFKKISKKTQLTLKDWEL